MEHMEITIPITDMRTSIIKGEITTRDSGRLFVPREWKGKRVALLLKPSTITITALVFDMKKTVVTGNPEKNVSGTIYAPHEWKGHPVTMVLLEE